MGVTEHISKQFEADLDTTLELVISNSDEIMGGHQAEVLEAESLLGVGEAGADGRAAAARDAIGELERPGRARAVGEHVAPESARQVPLVGGRSDLGSLGEPAREAGLAGADWALYRKEAKWRLGHTRSTRCAAQAASNPAALPLPGMFACGSSSSSGLRTKARACMRGCGTLSRGPSIRASP